MFAVFLDSPLRGSQQQGGSKDGEEGTQLRRRVPETGQDGTQVKDVQTGEVSQGRSTVLTLDTPGNHIGKNFSQNIDMKVDVICMCTDLLLRKLSSEKITSLCYSQVILILSAISFPGACDFDSAYCFPSTDCLS